HWTHWLLRLPGPGNQRRNLATCRACNRRFAGSHGTNLPCNWLLVTVGAGCIRRTRGGWVRRLPLQSLGGSSILAVLSVAARGGRLSADRVNAADECAVGVPAGKAE